MEHIEQLGDRIANRIFALNQDVEMLSAQINDLRATMFRAADQLRKSEHAADLQDVISQLELPDRSCDGQGCAHAQQLEARIDQRDEHIRQLEAQIFAYETVIMTVTQQLGVSPTGEDYPDSGCCPRVIPNTDEDQST
jgi:hypothetical protein